MKNLRNTILVFLFFILTFGVFGQSRFHKNAIYGEGLGPGLLYSINYDWRFKRDYTGHGFRIGLGSIRNSNNNLSISVPVSYNFLFSNNFQTQYEIGLGLSFKYGHFPFAEFADKMVIGHGIIGIRYRPLRNGLFLKLAWTPLFDDSRIRYVHGGLGVGFSF